ncbi:MAG: hypothetical protein AB1427_21165 [Thermodesulfobacteriota bacterium]
MNDKKLDLPTPVLKYPHWRVNFRPHDYRENLIPSLSKCYEIIEKTKLSLRGWDYPHLSRRDTERSQGNNWVSSWSNFMGHYEYWRFYQSGQFLHLFSVREATEFEWKKKLQNDMQSHRILTDGEVDWEKIPGFFSIINFIYNITEIFEFAARLCQSRTYSGVVNIEIDIKGIQGFVLTAPWERAWHSYYAASQNILSKSQEIDSEKLVAASKDFSLSTIIWFFERFGWLSPSEDVIRKDQDNLIKGRF